jgi:hypothetical protein
MPAVGPRSPATSSSADRRSGGERDRDVDRVRGDPQREHPAYPAHGDRPRRQPRRQRQARDVSPAPAEHRSGWLLGRWRIRWSGHARAPTRGRLGHRAPSSRSSTDHISRLSGCPGDDGRRGVAVARTVNRRYG